MVKCAVRGCQNQSDLKPAEMRSRPRKRFFSFPADQGRVRVWMAALRESGHFSTEHRICEDHFLPEHITPGGISADAIPIMPPLEGAILSSGSWTSPVEHSEELSEVVTEIPADEEEDDDEQDSDDDDDDDDDEEEEEDDEDEEEYEDSDCTEEEPMHIEEAERDWLPRLQKNRKSSSEKKRVHATKATIPRSEVTLGRLTKRFMDLLHSAPEGILDLKEATEKLGTRKRRVYDITNALNGIKLITKKSKSKIQWVGSSPIGCFKSQWKNKIKTDLINLKSMEESLDWLIKDCAQQLFALTDLTENANLAYVTYEDICQVTAFRNQTVIAIKAPEETKLEVPTPTEDSIKIHLKGSRGPVHVLTCETSGSNTTTRSEQHKTGRFLTLEESRIETTTLLTDIPTISSAVRSA